MKVIHLIYIVNIFTAKEIIDELKKLSCRDNARNRTSVKMQILGLRFNDSQDDIEHVAEFERSNCFEIGWRKCY